MIETLLFYLHSALLLGFGVVLSYLMADIPLHRKNLMIALSFMFVSGLFQVLILMFYGEHSVWIAYPFIVHLPLSLLLIFYYKRNPSTIVASVSTAYMFCQPANWVGLVVLSLTKSTLFETIAQIITLFAFGFVVVVLFTPFFSKIFAKSDKNTFIFGTIPLFYYLFDYIAAPFAKQIPEVAELVLEFMPLFICVVYLILSSIYYHEHELNEQNEMKDKIVQTALYQQARELELLKNKSHEIHLLRHDLRFLMNNLALSIQNDDKETAMNLISGYVDLVNETKVTRYCSNDTVNYVLSSYADKCLSLNINYETTIQLESLNKDEIQFSTILSNALDNALNATKLLKEEKRFIKVMIKDNDGKLLLSVRNTYLHEPVFKDGIPVTTKKSHGYGTQSIRFITEKLGGNFQFSTNNGWFILRIVL